MKYLILILLTGCLLGCGESQKEKAPDPTGRWSQEKAWEWYDRQPWLIGVNFIPSTAINQLEFWQEDTFDPATIDRELAWSADLGMNLHRVFLHNLLWDQDPEGFLKRMETYLELADSHGIKTMFVLLDDVWHPVPKLGKQPDPIPHVHNSGWVQAPGAAILGDSTRHKELEGYVKGVLSHFARDNRVLVWDVYNEPDNVAGQKGRAELEVKNKKVYTLALLKKVFSWAREVNPSQPLTTGIWKGDVGHWGNPDSLPPLDRYMMEHSEVISFHAYDGDMKQVREKIQALKTYGRPLFCTEYLARGVGNTFEKVLPILKAEKIAAINWGLVSGKTNTIYPWSSWDSTFTAEPKVWHHDIFRKEGSPFSEREVDLIRELTAGNKKFK